MDIRLRAFVLCLVLLSPFWVHAEGLAAGIAPGPVWLSTSNPESGEKVSIYTVLYDGSETPIEGSVTFSVDGTSVGSVPFSLNPGETSVKSVTWTAIEGEHALQATIDTAIDRNLKQTATIANKTTEHVAVAIEAKKQTSTPLSKVETVVPTISAAVASGTPAIAGITGAVIQTGETLRTSAESYLSTLAGSSTAATSTQGSSGKSTSSSVAGQEVEGTKHPSLQPQGGMISSIASFLLPFVHYPALFYPVLFILLGGVFFLIANRIRNPGSRGRRR